jgi:hypothetical protein
LVARDWDAYRKLKPSKRRLPTGWEQPDFVVTDEENGVVAVKHGKELLYASLYWRARQGVNDYARIHHLTPRDQRSATLRQESAGNTEETFTVRDWVLWDYAINDPAAGHIPPGGFPPPGPEIHLSLAGDVLRVAPIPADVPDPALGVHFDGVEQVLVGRAPFYLCVYGPYLIAMNTSTDRTFTVPARPGFGAARNVTDHNRLVPADRRLAVGPRSTVILHRE